MVWRGGPDLNRRRPQGLPAVLSLYADLEAGALDHSATAAWA